MTALRALPWRSPVTIMALLAVAAFLFLGLRGLIAPEVAVRSLGVTLADVRDGALMQTTGARNIGMSLLGAALVVIDARRAFGLLLAAAALIACLDFAVIRAASGLSEALKHLGYVAFLGGFAAVVLRGTGR
ncbi:MAG: DUF4267 domain-containing protein [Gemmobacter sp.]